MARVKKNQEHWHVITIGNHIDDNAELILIGHGKNSYLWVSDRDGRPSVSFSGAKTLKALALAILKEVDR